MDDKRENFKDTIKFVVETYEQFIEEDIAGTDVNREEIELGV